jgi:hypothetical protein
MASAAAWHERKRAFMFCSYFLMLVLRLPSSAMILHFCYCYRSVVGSLQRSRGGSFSSSVRLFQCGLCGAGGHRGLTA